MRVSRLKTSLFFSFLLLTFLSLTIPVRAADDDDDQADDYDVKARVARISLIGGEVNLRRAGNKDWEPARTNYPLVEGDTVMTGKGSFLEVQVDSRNFVRLTAGAMMRIVTLRDEGVALRHWWSRSRARLSRLTGLSTRASRRRERCRRR